MLRFELPAEKKLVHEMRLPIRWGDMDLMGHVNNTVYFRYFETSRITWLGGIGAPPNPLGEGPVILNAFCTFYQQLAFPDELLLRHFVANVGRTSFDTYITMERTAEPGVICADGGARAVWTDSRIKKSAPIPDWLRVLIT